MKDWSNTWADCFGNPENTAGIYPASQGEVGWCSGNLDLEEVGFKADSKEQRALCIKPGSRGPESETLVSVPTCHIGQQSWQPRESSFLQVWHQGFQQDTWCNRSHTPKWGSRAQRAVSWPLNSPGFLTPPRGSRTVLGLPETKIWARHEDTHFTLLFIQQIN